MKPHLMAAVFALACLLTVSGGVFGGPAWAQHYCIKGGEPVKCPKHRHGHAAARPPVHHHAHSRRGHWIHR